MNNNTKMILTPEEARDVICRDHKDFQTLEESIVWEDCYMIQKEMIVAHLPTGRYFIVTWNIDSTKRQHLVPFQYDDEVEFHQVEKVEKLVSIWERK